MWESPKFRGNRRGTAIAHTANRALFRYWDRLRGDRPAPMRHEVEPADIGTMLSDTYILEALNDREYAYRLAGTRVCGYFGRELKGENWLAGWPAEGREALETLLRAVVKEGTCALVQFTGHTENDQSCPFESLLLPLCNRSAGFTRILGATQPLDNPYWLGAHPIAAMEPNALQVIWPNKSRHFRTPSRSSGGGRGTPVGRRGHLVLYEGGRND